MQRPMITKEGIYTQGIYGFLNMLNKITEDYQPEYLAVAFDLKAPTFRHKAYDGYKAGRKPMPAELAMEMPILKDILRAMNIGVLSLEGYEADDILGTVSLMAEKEGIEPIVVTGDKDALQLASDLTKVIITKRGVTDFDLYDSEKMLERYGLTPSQFIDLKGIMGDSSDNIPGIPGIGEKGGIELLKQFGSIEYLLEHTDEIKKPSMRKKVEENAELCRKSKWLATILRDAPLEISLDDLKVAKPDYNSLVDIYKKLEFNSFLKKLSLEQAPAAPAETVIRKKIIFDNSDANALLLDGDNPLVLDCEDPLYIKVFGSISHISKPEIEGIFLMNSEKEVYITGKQNNIEALIQYLNSIKPLLTGHDIKDDIYALMSFGLESFNVFFDTAVCEYVLDVTKSKYDLNSISLDKLGRSVETTEMRANEKQLDFLSVQDNTDSNIAFGEACGNIVFDLMKVQKEEIVKSGAEKLLYEVELPLVEVLASMELSGIRCDKEYLDEFGVSLSNEIDLAADRIYDRAGMRFNIKSTQQLGEVLFEKLGLPSGKKTKNGYSTAQDVLDKIRGLDPIIDDITSYRNLTKLNSTYIEGMKPLIDEGGRIHCHFMQTVTQTGRLSCADPNLQNIPIKQELGRKIRKAFLPSEGHTLVGADYSQIELRVLAGLSEDEALIKAFNEGQDIHKLTASRVLNIPMDQVTPLDRSRAKAVNFGVIYGMSGFGLSEEINTTRKEAEEYIEEYFIKHPKVKAYMDSQKTISKERGYTETILSRKRYIPEISASNFMVRQLGERLAMNTPIQGSAADIIKIAMNSVYRELKEKHPNSKLILQVHDELIIDAANEELEEIKDLLLRNMENAYKFPVKLIAELNTADNWYDLK